MSGIYPPGPEGKFKGLNLGMRFSQNPIAFGLDLLQYDERFLHAQFGPTHLYFALSPQTVHEVLVKQARKFNKSQMQKKAFGKFSGNGLVNNDGDFWKRQRKLMQPAFHHKRIRGYVDTIVGYTRERYDLWQRGQEINIMTEMLGITLDVVASTLFGTSVRAEAKHIEDVVMLLQQKAFAEMSAFFTLPDWLPLPHKRREAQAIRDLRGIIMQMIHERRASGEDRGDLLSMLLMARDEDGSGMSDEQACDEAVTLFVAGHETTATALAWTWYLLAAHPEVEAKLVHEIDAALDGRAATFEDLPKLKYAEMVFKEAMRLYPPAWMFSRQVVEPVEIVGYTLPVGAMVSLCPFVTHHDPRLWEAPFDFIPERFTPEQEAQRPDYAYYPFGGGPRVCIGNSFAMMEGQLVLATLLQRFRFSLAPGQGTPELQPLIALRPKDGIRLVVHERDTAVRDFAAEYASAD